MWQHAFLVGVGYFGSSVFGLRRDQAILLLKQRILPIGQEKPNARIVILQKTVLGVLSCSATMNNNRNCGYNETNFQTCTLYQQPSELSLKPEKPSGIPKQLSFFGVNFRLVRFLAPIFLSSHDPYP